MLTAKTAAALIAELESLLGWAQGHRQLLCYLDYQYSWLLDSILGIFQGSAGLTRLSADDGPALSSRLS